jgi:hypothetical protein
MTPSEKLALGLEKLVLLNTHYLTALLREA